MDLHEHHGQDGITHPNDGGASTKHPLNHAEARFMALRSKNNQGEHMKKTLGPVFHPLSQLHICGPPPLPLYGPRLAFHFCDCPHIHIRSHLPVGQLMHQEDSQSSVVVKKATEAVDLHLLEAELPVDANPCAPVHVCLPSPA